MSYTPPLEAEVTAFKTTALLANGATYTSSDVDWDGDVNGCSQVQTEILASHDGNIDISFCEDSAFTDVVRTISIPYTASGGYQFFAAPAFANFIKYEFTNNGGVTQTDFYYTTKLLTTAISPQLLTTGAFIAPAMVTTLNRSITVGQDPNAVFTNTPSGGISDVNSSVAPLGAGATFSGTFTDTSGYASTSIFMKSDQDSAADGLKIIHSSDGVTDERVISFTYLTASNPQGLVYMIPASTKYFRVQYINGSTPQSSFVMSIKNETSPQQTIALPVNLPIKDGTLSNVTKSVIVGQNDAGNFENVPIDTKGHLEVNVTNPNTSYDEVQVAQLTPVSQLSFPYNINADIVTTILGGSGTVTQGDNMAVLSTSVDQTAVESAALESKETITFRAGQGSLARFSVLFTNSSNGPTSIQGIGVGDANDGYGFALIGSVMNISYRTNGAVDTPPANQTNVVQTLWNNDVMDGTGSVDNPSGMLLDPTLGNVYQISYGSGFGCINFSIESDVTGRMILVHVLHLANILDAPSAYNPTFALRAEVFKVGTSDANNYVMKVADMSSFVEGNNLPTGPVNGFTNIEDTNNTTDVLMFTLYNNATFASKTNKVSCLLQSISIASGSGEPGVVKIIEDGSLTGAGTPNDISTGTSVVSTDITATAISGGRVLWVGSVAKDGGTSVDISNLGIRMRPGSHYTVTTALVTTAQNKKISAGVVWKEDF